MKTLVKSLKRLYKTDKVTIEKLKQMKADNKITQEEFTYITVAESEE